MTLNKISNCRVCGDNLTDENWYPSFKSANQRICSRCRLAQRAAARLKWKTEFKSAVADKYPFQCRVCNSELTDGNWMACDKKRSNRICKECANRYQRQLYASCPHVPIKRKHIPKLMSENRECTLFLGVHVAERVLSNVFKHVYRMPIHNPGYDFVCNRGKKIDVKASCVNKDGRWKFKIEKNQVPNFFLMVAFDNRKKLNPMYIWLIPRNVVCHKHTVSIAPSTVSKWDEYRLDVKKVITCCKEMRS